MDKITTGKKMKVIRRMLTRRKGCTSAEVKEALDWPSVSIPQRARQLGLEVRSQKIGRVTRYWAI